MKKRVKKHYYYRHGSTHRALASFERMLPKMGKIKKVIGTFDNRRWYRIRFVNHEGKQFIYSGFSWGFNGTGCQGLANCLNKIGLDQTSWLFDSSNFSTDSRPMEPGSLIIHIPTASN